MARIPVQCTRLFVPTCSRIISISLFYSFFCFTHHRRCKCCKWPQKWRISQKPSPSQSRSPRPRPTPNCGSLLLSTSFSFTMFLFFYYFVATTLWHVCKSWARPRNSHVLAWNQYCFGSEDSRLIAGRSASIIKQLITQRIPQFHNSTKDNKK